MKKGKWKKRKKYIVIELDWMKKSSLNELFD